MKLGDIIKILESEMPLALQESYDNAGLYCGETNQEVDKILLTLDITVEVVEEAIESGCRLIVAHHPLIFKPLKRLTESSYLEKALLLAIRNDIALYAAHTNLDNIKGGVSFKLAEKLCLKEVKVLAPMQNTLLQLVVFVPLDHTLPVLNALAKAGAGQIGNYRNCSFYTEGTGTFLPLDSATPFLGKTNEQTYVNENKVEVVFPFYMKSKVLEAMHKSHPYEEVAYFLTELGNQNQDVGSGAVGVLDRPYTTEDFLAHLKQALKLDCIRFTPLQKHIRTVAVCGGAGSFLLKTAIQANADAYVSADFKYHEFFDAENKIMIADVGHYESEFYTKELFCEILTKKIPNIALLFSTVNTNPVKYYH